MYNLLDWVIVFNLVSRFRLVNVRWAWGGTVLTDCTVLSTVVLEVGSVATCHLEALRLAEHAAAKKSVQ